VFGQQHVLQPDVVEQRHTRKSGGVERRLVLLGDDETPPDIKLVSTTNACRSMARPVRPAQFGLAMRARIPGWMTTHCPDWVKGGPVPCTQGERPAMRYLLQGELGASKIAKSFISRLPLQSYALLTPP